jgi:C-terminal processing protease CtpA/Prc
MKYKLYLYITLASLFFSCVSTKKNNIKLTQKHSPLELKKDLSIIKSSLEEAHPGLYWYITKEKLDFKFDSIQNLLTDSMSSIAFYRITAPVVSDIKCGHTRLIYAGLKLSKVEKNENKKNGPAPLSQLQYKVENDRLFIVANRNKTSTQFKSGAEIISIDSIPAAKLLEKTKRLFSPDGYNLTFYNEVLNKTFAGYYYLAFAKRDSNLIVLKDSAGLCIAYLKTDKPDTSKIKSTSEQRKKQQQETIAKRKFEKKNKYKGLDENKQPLLDFKIDTTLESTAIMKVKSFSFPYNNFHKFFKESFKSLEENKIQNLVLDVRGNGGGNLMSCNLLFRYLYNQPHQFTTRADMKTRRFSTQKYIEKTPITKFSSIILFPFLWLDNQINIKKDSSGYYAKLPTQKLNKPKTNHYDNNLIILINGYSFSATSLLSANLQSVNRGYFVGEETGGGFNQCSAGSIPYINLPNTGLKLRLPLKVIQIAELRELIGRGIFPNLEIKPTVADVLKGKDVVMDKAVEKINLE